MDKSQLVQDSITISITGITVIFFSLTMLILAFKFLIPFIMGIPERIKSLKGTREAEEAIKHKEVRNMPGEINAVIAVALKMHLDEAHDDEDTCLTIQKQKRSYSPWSSKIFSTHGVR